MRLIGVLVSVFVVLGSVPATADGPPQARPGAAHAVPLHGALLRIYDAPDDPYAPGHRGVDVGAEAGSAVRASADGVVAFAGAVAGNRTVTVDHGGGLSTTASYLAVVTVTKGAPVRRGDAVGTVGAGHPDQDLPAHVHLSARRDGVYIDPLSLYVGNDHSDLVSLVG